MSKTRRLIPISSTIKYLDYLASRHGMSDKEIALVIGSTPAFVGMVRLRELPLTLDHVENMADAVGLPFGEFLLAAMPHPLPDGPQARHLKEMLQMGDRVVAAIERDRGARRPPAVGAAS